MAVIDTTRHAAAASMSGGIFNIFHRLAAWNEARLTRRVLARLSDRELDDIGLSRCQIDQIRF